jgi:hypothetical protein
MLSQPTFFSCHCLAHVNDIKAVLRAQVRICLTLQQEVPLVLHGSRHEHAPYTLSTRPAACPTDLKLLRARTEAKQSCHMRRWDVLLKMRRLSHQGMHASREGPLLHVKRADDDAPTDGSGT